ncbi:MAG: hypothetical protein IKA64_05250 [Clostridia bacterium]|nr:hypothetical protein [Clostridia bacterium]
MKKCKYLIAFLLIFALIPSLCLTSCKKNRDYDEAEVKAAVEELLRKAEILNTVYYGAGIGYITGGYRDGAYYEADGLHLSALGFSSIKELEALTRSTFTRGYSDQLVREKLGEVRVDGVMLTPARYYQKYADEFYTEEICIMVYSGNTAIFDDRMEYDYSTVKVLGSEGEKVKASIEATVSNKDGDTQRVTVSVVLIEEDGWRIDNPVFKNYIAE